MDDFISRQAVDKIINDLLENDNLQASPSVWHGLRMIKQLPSAVVRGKWIRDKNGVVKCDQCGGRPPFYMMASTYMASMYCPDCGARMTEENDG